MNTATSSKKGTFGLLKATFDDWMEDKALRLSAAVAYYSIFSLAPLLVIAIAVAGLVFGQEAVRGQLGEQLKQFVGPQAAQTVQSMIQSAAKPSHGWIATIVGFITLLLGASGVFGQLKDALNTIWEVQAKKGAGIKGFIKERILSFGMVLVIGFLLLTSLLLTTLLAGMTHWLSQILPMPPFVWGVITFVVSFAVATLLFACIFKVLPDVKLAWRDVWIGAAVTALLFEIGKFALGWYLGKQGAESSYGAATSIVLLLLWVYYNSCILFFGAEFTQVYAQSRGVVIQPKADAELLTPEARAQQGLAPVGSPAAAKSAPASSPATATVGPKKEVLPRPEPRILADVPAQSQEEQPLGMLLAVTGASMVLGLLSRGWAQKTKKPSTQLKEGLYGVGREALVSLGGALGRAKEKIEHKMG
jgi:membrane protein